MTFKLIRLSALLALGSMLISPPAHALLGPSLAVHLSVDKGKAVPGETLEYVVRVTNVGDVEARRVEMTSHYPTETTAASTNCPEGTFEPDGDICIAPDVPTPGVGDPVHQVSFGFGPVAPGQTVTFTFAVRIDDDATIGRRLFNHAHASADLGPETTSNTVHTDIVAHCDGHDHCDAYSEHKDGGHDH